MILRDYQESAPTISIRVWDGPLDLNADDKNFYSAIGYFTSRMAGLEFTIDKFIFLVSRVSPRLARTLSKRIPVKMSDKIDFLIWSFVSIPETREVGDRDGCFDLNFLGYALEELWDFRNHCIHGAIEYIKDEDGRFRFTSSRYDRIDSRKSRIVTYNVGQGYIEIMLHRAAYVEAIISDASKILNGANRKGDRDRFLKNLAGVREVEALLGRSIFEHPDAVEV